MSKKKSSPFMIFVKELQRKSGKRLTLQDAVAEGGDIWKVH